jgi:hypothetical protein
MSFCQGSSAYAAAPEEQFIEAVKVALGKNFNTDWSGLDALPGIKWAPLPFKCCNRFESTASSCRTATRSASTTLCPSAIPATEIPACRDVNEPIAFRV